MLRKLVFMLLVVSLALTASSGFCTVWRYWGNVSPDTVGLLDAEAFGPYTEYGSVSNLGELVNDAAASDGKAWRINDTDPAVNDVWRTPGIIDLGSTTGATIIARIKTISETGGGGNIGIAQQNYGSFVHWGGANGLLKETVRGDEITLPVPPADGNYHVIRLTAQGEFVGTVPPISYNFDGLTAGNLSGQNGWSGDTTNAVQVVGGQLSVAAATVNPSGATPATRAFAINPDVNGKITVSITFYAQATFVDGWVWQFRINDSNNLPMAGWQGSCTGVRARIGGVATGAVELAAGPHVLKIVYDVSTNIGSYYIDDALHGTLSCDTLPDEGNRLGYIEINQKGDDARASGHSVIFDNLLIEGAEIPNTSRTINMYVDDVLEKSITYAATANIAGGKTDNFVFGSGAGMQDVYFDWIVMTNEGAFAPADDIKQYGHTLNGGSTALTSFADVKTAPEGSQVTLTDAVVTASFNGFKPNLSAGYVGFAVEDTDRFAGIRVAYYDTNYIPLVNDLVNIEGTIALQDGERVIIASRVTESTTPAGDPIKPLAIPNKSAAGGASGVQAAMVDYATRSNGAPSFEESFTYDNGALAGNGGWTGDATSRLAVDNGALKISSHGYDFPTDVMKITKTLNAGDCGTGEITLKMKIQKGVGADTYWDLRIKDSAGLDICYMFGAGEFITGRGQGDNITTGAKNLNSGWNDLEIKIVGGNSVQFFLNTVAMNASTFSAAFDGSIGSIEINRLGNVCAVQSNVAIDDLQIFPSATTGTGLNTVGILQTIYGRVTHVKSSAPSSWDDYFYIDDGTGYVDGTSDGSSTNVGIRCRPSSAASQQLYPMPATGDYVAVTGVMGARAAGGNIIRNFWTTFYSDPLEVIPE